MKESKAMMKKEVAFMKKKGAPKSMIRHEEAEYGMKKGTKKMAFGGMTLKPPKFKDEGPVQQRNTRFAGGGSASSRADGIAHKGKTKGKMVKMAMGGKC